mgnify:FL=1
MNNVKKIVKEYKGEVWTKAIGSAYDKIKKDVTVDGFRKGMVPFDMFVSKNGVEPLYNDAIDILLTTEYKKVFDEVKEIPVVQPSIDIKNISKDAISIEYTFISSPEVKLGAYKNLGIKKETAKVTAKEVKEEIEKLQAKYAEIQVKETGKVENGNTVVIDFEGFLNGKPFEGGKAENYPLEIGSHTFIPGFEEGLIGMSTGEEKDLNLTFPENYTEELKGKDVTFKVKVNIIKEKVLPEINEDFFKDLGYDDVKTKEELEAKIKEQIKTRKEADIENKYIDECLEAATSNMKVEINPEIIDDEIHRMIDQMSEQLKMNGLTLEQYMQFTGMTHEDLHKQYEEMATKRVKERFLLENVAKVEKIEISDKDAEAKALEMAKNYGMTKEDLLKEFGGLDMVKYDMKMRAAINIVKGE